MIREFILVLLCLIPILGFSQDLSINGVVTDNENQPLIGVNILIQGTARGTLTDLNGKYTIRADKGDVLVFSYIRNGIKRTHSRW